MEPGGVARVVVFKIAGVDGAGGLPQGVGGKVPASAGTEEMDAQLRPVLDGVLGPAGGVALPRRHEHVPHADVVDHIAPGGGQAVPALVLHIGLHPVQPSRGNVKRHMPAAVLLHPALRPGTDALAAGLQGDPGLHRHGALPDFGELQRQLKGLADPGTGPGQLDPGFSRGVLLKDLPGHGAPLYGDSVFHSFTPLLSPLGAIFPRPNKRALCGRVCWADPFFLGLSQGGD